MSFATFGLVGTIAGAVTLVGILFLLQRLRAQRRVIRLPTAALWAQAVGEAPARRLGARFRQWPGFLLLVLIALLMWLAAAQPQVEPDGPRGVTKFYFDNSALMTADGEFANARDALLADIGEAPPEGREVFLGDAVGTRLLAPGENISLLSRRLDLVETHEEPSHFREWVERQRRAGTLPSQIRYYGAAATAGLAGDTQPQMGYLSPPVPDNRGITGFGATPAASGDAAKADVLVSVAAASGALPTPDELRWTRNGAPVASPRLQAMGDGRYLWRDADADGAVLGVSLADGDGFAADDSARLRLPERRTIRVALLAGTPVTIRKAVAADPGLEIVGGDRAQVLVGNARATGSDTLPALVIETAASQPQAFVFAGPGEAGRSDVSTRIDEFGLARIDAAALADALGRPIGVDVADADRRTIGVWGEIVAQGSPLADGPALPLFVSQGLRWLANIDGWHPYSKAGEPMLDQSALYGLPTSGRADALGALEPAPETASLTDRAVTLAAARPLPSPSTVVEETSWPAAHPFLLLILAAGMLLAVEWVLFHRGRVA